MLQLIKYAVALGETESARQIQTLAIEVLDRESIRNAIPALRRESSVRRANRWFLAAVILSALFAAGHTAGFFVSRHAARTDPNLTVLTRAMQRHRAMSLVSIPPSLIFANNPASTFPLVDPEYGLSLSTPRLASDPQQAYRFVGLLNFLGFSLLAILSFFYSVPQGIISAGLIAGCYLATFLLSRAS